MSDYKNIYLTGLCCVLTQLATCHIVFLSCCVMSVLKPYNVGFLICYNITGYKALWSGAVVHTAEFFLCKERCKIEGEQAAGGDFWAVQPNLMWPWPHQNFQAVNCWWIFTDSAYRLGPLGPQRDAACCWLKLTNTPHCTMKWTWTQAMKG